MLLSPNHHGRHLQDEDDRARFARTAPIETAGYWDLAEAVTNPNPDPQRVEKSASEVLRELEERALTGDDKEALKVTRAFMHRVIDSTLES